MKFYSSALLAFLTTSLPAVQGYANQWEAEIYNDMNVNTVNKMWVFSQDGVRMFSPDGSELVVYHKNEEVCDVIEDPWEPPGTIRSDCWHMSAAHDGENYVFINNGNWVEESYVDVFSMWNGRYLGNVPICTLAYNMMFLPNRKELWVDCWLRPSEENKSNTTDFGNVEVLSTQNIGGPVTHIDVHGGLDMHNHGNILVHESIPNKAYRFTMQNSNIYEIHAGSKRVEAEIAVDKTQGTYEYAFSPTNKHIFMRIYTCCACGEFKDTREVCPAWVEPVTVEFGPNASPDPQPGYCGKFCRGTEADVEGVWEFDTSNNAFLGQHLPLPGAYGVKPFATPRGDYILLGHGDGGNGVKVLRAGASGELSQQVGVINLDFAADIGTHALSDIAFIEDNNRNIAVFTSTLNNHVVLVDLSEFDSATAQNPVTVDGVDVDLFEEPQEEISVGHDIRGISVRRVRWAEGTNYVWVDSQETDQLHVIELGETLADARTIRTIDEVAKTRQMLWVHNYEADAKAIIAAADTTVQRLEEIETNEESTNVLAMVGVALAGVALFVGLVNIMMLMNAKSANEGKQAAVHGSDDPSEQTPISSVPEPYDNQNVL